MNIGILFIVSAPSGAGKTSLLKAMMANAVNIAVSVSHTTRQSRPGEENGQDYHFVSKEKFEQMVSDGEFLEHAQVFDNYYGTAIETVKQQLNSGQDVVLEIDWQGARQVREHFAEAVSIFVVPPTIDALRERLSARGQDSDEIIERRMRDAMSEMSHFDEYDYVVVNDQFEDALKDLCAIVRTQHLFLQQQKERVPVSV